MRATRTYLELRDSAPASPVTAAPAGARLERLTTCPVSFSRYLYHEVGRGLRWTDRDAWPDAELRAYLDRPGIGVWLLSIGGAPAGYFELNRDPDGSVEIAYFGLLPDFHGRGLGRWLLEQAIHTAWTAEPGLPTPTRVWLHTCTFDHPAALPNYRARGFDVFRTEEYEVTP